MTRHRPSASEIAAALRYYEGLRPDGKPPPEKENAELRRPGVNEDSGRSHYAANSSTERELAQERFRQAKVAYTAAAKAVIDGEPDAVEQAAGALQEVKAALEELARGRRFQKGLPTNVRSQEARKRVAFGAGAEECSPGRGQARPCRPEEIGAGRVQSPRRRRPDFR
jgi:hypothetical protein